MNSRILIGLLALPFTLGASGLVGCDTGDSGGDSTLTLELTDAPADDITAAVVTIDEIYLQSETRGRVVLRDTPETVDLLTLRNDTQTLVDAAVIPEGTYGQLRFVISRAYIEVTSGDHEPVYYVTAGDEAIVSGTIAGELKTPSWDASGLKVKLPDDGGLTVASDSRVLLVDFDVAQSFRTETGNGDWVMSPVVDAIDIELTTSVAVEVRLGVGVVLEVDLGGLFVELLDVDGARVAVLPLGDDDGNGVYGATFRYVDPREGPFSARLLGPDLEPTAFDLGGTGSGITGQSGTTVEVTLTLQ